jgi:hypothetical protein
MSRGGRGGGRGGKRGPDMSWQDEDPNEPVVPQKNVPGPLFPVCQHWRIALPTMRKSLRVQRTKIVLRIV